MRRIKDWSIYCPTARAVEVLDDRWTVQVLGELLAGSQQVGDIRRGLPGVRRSVITRRLRRLESHGLVRGVDNAYRLTDAGHALAPALAALADWARAHVLRDPRPDELDADLYIWWLSGGVDARDRRGREVVRFDIGRGVSYWFLIENGEVSVHTDDHGFEVDVRVAAHLSTLLQLWRGRIRLADALVAETLVVFGRRDLTAWVCSWLTASTSADLVAGNR